MNQTLYDVNPFEMCRIFDAMSNPLSDDCLNCSEVIGQGKSPCCENTDFFQRFGNVDDAFDCQLSF